VPPQSEACSQVIGARIHVWSSHSQWGLGITRIGTHSLPNEMTTPGNYTRSIMSLTSFIYYQDGLKVPDNDENDADDNTIMLL